MTDKTLEDLINQVNKLYLEGKGETLEYKDLTMKMANYISQKAPKSSYSIENDPNYWIGGNGDIHRRY